MTRTSHSTSHLLMTSYCLGLIYALALTLFAPFAVRGATVTSHKKKSVSTPLDKPAAHPGKRRDGELIIRFREGVSEQTKSALLGAKGASRKRVLRGRSRIEKLALAAGKDPEAVAESLRHSPEIEFVEPNYLVTRDEIIPNDARFNEQWSLRNAGQSGGQVGADINAVGAWETTTGSATTVVAVIDSGIDFTHPDLINNQWTNSRESSNRQDDDGNGLVDDLHGWDWVASSHLIRDEQGHGTSVAGIIAAQGNNQTGISGVMWRASLMSLRVLDNTGTGDVADAIEAIDYATAHGAQVINCSWGTEEMSLALRDAIDRAGQAGVVVVCSAGNAGSDLEVTPYYPSSFGLPNVISVASSDSLDSLASWSNYGSMHVAVAAPGTDILTTKMGGGYRSVSGTSASSPVVAGVAGLVKTKRPWLSAADTISALTQGARAVPGLAGRVSTGGIVSAAGALAAMRGPDAPPVGGGNNGGYIPPPPSGQGGGGTATGTNTPPPVTPGAPGPNLPNLDALRQQQPAPPTSHGQIHSNLPCADCDVSNNGGYTPSNDARYSTSRTRLENETGEPGFDLGSRNLNWSLPLLSLPGRAGLDLSLSLSYNSLVWTKQDNGIKFNADRGFPGPGFHLGFPVLQPRYLNADTAAYAYMLVLPSGGRVDMRQVGTSNTYESSDSTYTQMKYYAEGTGYAYVYLADGTNLIFHPSVDNEMRCTQIKDRNGNYITIGYDSLGHIVSATDTLGRVINFNYYSDSNLESITQWWSGGWHTWAKFYYGLLYIDPDFSNNLSVAGPDGVNQTVLTRVELEDKSYYDFSYTNWGQIWKITRFASDTTQLAYTSYNLPGSPLLASSTQTDCPRFSEQRLWARDWNNGAEALTSYVENYDPVTNAIISTEMTLPDRTTKIKESFWTANGWRKGLTTGTEIFSGSTRMKWTTTDWTQDNESLAYPQNPRVKETNVYDAQNNRRRTVVTYTSQFGLPSDVDEYDALGQTILRRTHTDYEFDPAYIDRRIIGLPTYKYVYEGTSTLLSKTGYFYDWWATHYEDTPQPATQHDPAYGLNLIRGRGNLVMELRFNVNDPNNAQNTIIEHKWGYNTCGSLTFDRDHLWHQTNISYADSYSDSSIANTYAYPTQVTDADGYISSAKYRYDFGAMTRAQGPPPATQSVGLIQEMSYDDYRRMTRISTKVDNAEYYYKRWVYYNDGMTEVEYSSINGLTDDTYAYSGRDGAGNVRATAQYHPGSTGGFSAQYTYRDAMNRVVQQSSPTEINAYFQATGDDSAGWQWTLQQYDWKGRPTITTLPGGATVENTYGGCGCAGGEQLTTKDERGRRRKLSKDVFGRLKQVEELNWNQTTYATTVYEYSALDQLKTMTQLGPTTQQNRVRSFDYDGYGRLWKRTTPEQGQVEYNYNADDTIHWFKDARGVQSNFTYNNRQMPLSVTYELSGVLAGQNVAATPKVTYQYDAAGNRTQMMTGQPGDSNYLSTVNYSYDTLSRMTSETIQFNGISRSHTLTYAYNRAGELTNLTNPFNSQSSYSYDRMGRPTTVNGSGDVSAPAYVNNILYRAWGAAKQVNYGNTRTLTASFDSRQRLTQWNIAGVLGYDYSYNYFGENSSRVTFAHNITTTQPGGQVAARDASLDRSYDYDHVGRLTASYTGTAALAHTGQGSTWGNDGPYAQTYAYDQWGNMTSRGGWGGENPSYAAVTFPTTNRLPYNPVTGAALGYDAAGNLTSDGALTYQYDATGQQTYASGGNLYQSYDGDRLRVKKVENGTTVFYIRSTVLGGQVVADAGVAGQWVRGYIYMGGQLLAFQENGRVLWVHEEPITKAKRTTDTAGAVHTLTELDPWGGETNRSYWSGLQPHKYTTYERDANGSDEAMHRRYNRLSRFDQPDPYDGSYDLTNPQSFNRYSYVQNDPVSFTDPTGLMCFDIIRTDYIVQTNEVIWSGRVGTVCNGWSGLDIGNFDVRVTADPEPIVQEAISLPCPPPEWPKRWSPISADKALHHYIFDNGEDIRIPLSAINADFPLPTNFPSVRNLINQGTGGKPWVQHTINGAQSDPVATSGGQSAYLGRITFTASGVLNVYMTGHYQFYGSVGVMPDLYDFDRDRARSGSRRGFWGSLSTRVGSAIPGTPYKFITVGRATFSVEGGPGGLSLATCQR